MTENVRMQCVGYMDIHSLERNPEVITELVDYNSGRENKISEAAEYMLDIMTHPTRWTDYEDERPVLGRIEFLLTRPSRPGSRDMWTDTTTARRLTEDGGYRNIGTRVLEDLVRPEAVYGRDHY